MDGDSGSSFDPGSDSSWGSDSEYVWGHGRGPGLGALGAAVIVVWTIAGVHWIGPDPREGAFHALDDVRLLLQHTTEQTESTAAERAATAGYAVREIRRIRGELARARARTGTAPVGCSGC